MSGKWLMNWLAFIRPKSLLRLKLKVGQTRIGVYKTNLVLNLSCLSKWLHDINPALTSNLLICVIWNLHPLDISWQPIQFSYNQNRVRFSVHRQRCKKLGLLDFFPLSVSMYSASIGLCFTSSSETSSAKVRLSAILAATLINGSVVILGKGLIFVNFPLCIHLC